MEDRQVSLKQVLDTVDEMPVMKDNNGMEFIEKSFAKTRIGLLPSAQPEKRTKERTETHACDSISRQDAIDIFDDYNISVENGELEAYSRDRKRLCDLPSAQTETAKRIVGKSRNGMTLWYQCDMCNEPVDAQDNFCRGCGRRLTDG